MRLQTLTGIASIPAVQALAVSSLLWLIIFVYCNYALWRDPHGAYFHSENVYDLDYSLVRQEESRGFLHQLTLKSLSNATTTDETDDADDTGDNIPPIPPPVHASDHPILCAAFATVRRPRNPNAVHYFSDSVGSMLEGLTPKERAAINATVLFANADDPTKHPDYSAPWLPALVDHYAGYEHLSDDEIAELLRLQKGEDFQRKGVLDYLYLLDRCYNETDAPFIGVFEDDIIFARDWFARTLLGLQELVKTTTPWLYLRLFYTETHMLWDAEADWWYGHMLTTFALASLATAAGLLLARQLMRQLHICGARTGVSGPGHLRLRLDMPTIAVLSIIVAPAFTALAFMAGKYNLPMYRLRNGTAGNAVGSILGQGSAGLVLMDRQGCCSQALIFDRKQVPSMIAYLSGRGRGQTDMMIEDYANENNLHRWALGEQAVQHVGTVSSRGGGGVKGSSVWAFYFEDTRPETVEKRKQKILEKIDWGMFESLR